MAGLYLNYLTAEDKKKACECVGLLHLTGSAITYMVLQDKVKDFSKGVENPQGKGWG